jgi:hypothetical protein
MLDRMFSQHPTIYKYDRTWIGVVLGLVVSMCGVVIIYLLSLGNHFFKGTEVLSIGAIIRNINSLALLSKFLSLGCILNLAVFFIFINKDYFNIARGIIFATMLVSLPIIVVTIRGWFA